MTPAPDYARDRSSESPIAIDVSENGRTEVQRSVASMIVYLGAGVLLGLVVIFALGVGRSPDRAAAGAGELTDPVMRLHAREIGTTCWQGYEKLGPARLTVALQVGLDGKVQYAAASGETNAMRGCVEAHVKSWEFLPQLQTQSMALPFEVDRR